MASRKSGIHNTGKSLRDRAGGLKPQAALRLGLSALIAFAGVAIAAGVFGGMIYLLSLIGEPQSVWLVSLFK